MSAQKLLEVKNIKKYFKISSHNYIHAVDDVSFDVYKGEIFGLVGESGSGKSTIGRCILNLLSIDSGEIWFDHRRLDVLRKVEMAPYRKRMQMFFQNPQASFNPKQFIGASFRELCGYYRINSIDRDKKITDLLQLINLPADVLNRLPNQLSGGQLQRLSIARALLLDPEFIVADEPVSALDVSVQAQILNLILDLRDQMGLTMIFISHDLNVVERVCDRVAVLYLGTIVEMADKKTLFYHTAHPYTEALMLVKPIDHPSKRVDREAVKGDIPSAVNIKEGCRFSTRCKYCRKGVCDVKTPTLTEIEKGHFVACHYPLLGSKEIQNMA